MTKIVLMLGRHGYPMERAVGTITPLTKEEDGVDSLQETEAGTWENSFYSMFHPERAAEILNALREKTANSADSDNLGSPIDGILTRQSKVSISIAAEELRALLKKNDIPLPVAAVSSPWPRAITTSTHYINELYQSVNANRQTRRDGTMRVAAVIDPTIGPGGTRKNKKAGGVAGHEILTTLAENPIIREAYQRAVAHGEDTIAIQVVSHDVGPFNMMAALMTPERIRQDKSMADFVDKFSPIAPLAGVAVVEVEVDDLADFKKVKTTDEGNVVLDIAPEKIRFLGAISPRAKMADIVDDIKHVLEAARSENACDKIDTPSRAPSGSRWTDELLAAMASDLQTGSTVLRGDDEYILKRLYPKLFEGTPQKKAIEHQQEALDTLRNWSLALEFVLQASKVRDTLGPDMQKALDALGDHQMVGRKIMAVGEYTEVLLAKKLWSRLDWEITPQKPTIQPPALARATPLDPTKFAPKTDGAAKYRSGGEDEPMRRFG